jgi:hypothetical protein
MLQKASDQDVRNLRLIKHAASRDEADPRTRHCDSRAARAIVAT